MSKRVALVKMPWSPTHVACITSALLKALLAREAIPADIFYLNLHLAKRLDRAAYRSACQTPLLGETAFAPAVFDQAANGENLADWTARRRFFIPKLSRVSQEIMEENQLAAFAAKAAREVVPEFLDDCLARIPWGDYAVVGFVTTFNQHLASLALARRIKEAFPAVSIVFGGANVGGSMGRETLRAFEWVDYIVDGEGDRSFPELVNNILTGVPFSPVPGVSFRQGGRLHIHKESYPPTDLDDLPVLDYADYPRELAATGLADEVGQPVYYFESSRGCWWGEKVQCAFCGVNGQTLAYRRKAAANVVQELADMATRYSGARFAAADSVVGPDFCQTLFPALKQYQAASGRKFSLFYEVKAGLSKEDLAVMKAAGVDMVQCGIESLNSDLLRLMRKGTTVLENIRLLKWCREKRITALWNMLFSIPGERPAHYNELLRLLPLVSHLEPPLNLMPISLQRFSAYHKFPGQFAITGIRAEAAYRRLYPPDKVNLDEIAYYFEYDGGDFVADPETHFDPLCAAIDSWTENFHRLIAFFEYAPAEDGVVELLDSRPLNGQVIPRRLVLDGLKARVFLYCDDIRTLPAIKAYLNEQTNSNLTDAQLQILLDELTADGIIYGENGRYLSLATYRPPELGPLFVKIGLPT